VVVSRAWKTWEVKRHLLKVTLEIQPSSIVVTMLVKSVVRERKKTICWVNVTVTSAIP
jgi:hypothetical protein